jgi:hypothetical protein
MTRSWIWFPNISVATFYHVGFDMEYPYNVCGGMQDNYDWCGPSAVRAANGITNDRWHTVAGRRRLRHDHGLSATAASSTPNPRTATRRGATG